MPELEYQKWQINVLRMLQVLKGWGSMFYNHKIELKMVFKYHLMNGYLKHLYY